MILDIKGVDIKPYVRMTRRGKWINEQAQEYLASKQDLSLLIKSHMKAQSYRIMPAQTPLKVSIKVLVHTSQGHKADIDNIAKAILDACNGIVFPDDRWVDKLWIRRFIGDKRYLSLSVDVMES
jgi:crossover junction endodeoxyribonuclease RusA